MMDLRARWDSYKRHLCVVPSVSLSLDTSRVGFDDAFLAKMKAPMQKAFDAMDALEKGAIANPDEQRQVGHYWLRDADLAPSGEIHRELITTLGRIDAFTEGVHHGRARGSTGVSFTDVVVIGIGGSALGPQLANKALGWPGQAMELHFFDNTDPDGMDTVVARLGDRLPSTLVVVISKSGGTKETRNGMLEMKWAMEAAGLTFAKHAVAVTGVDSALDKIAVDDEWLARFPMWDWVGGRTSELSAVGLLPASLQGCDIHAMLAGAKLVDAATRVHDVATNPAARLALSWYFLGNGKGQKDMVVLPYKDRLELFSRYLQQLVMESLGKEKDLDGKVVHQGIAVYGNKGSTDQHAYVQQLRDGLQNFFVTFIEVLRDRAPDMVSGLVDPGVTSGDYLLGFMLGTRRALYESERPSITITIDEVTPRSLGALIALFERAVGLYASLVNINAYHQPGVEAGKKAASDVLALQAKVQAHLATSNEGVSAETIAKAIGSDDVETIYKLCEHLAANERLTRYDPPEGETHPTAARFGV